SLTYISPLETMCTESYCKAIIGNRIAYPIQYDNAHLTPEGSGWFIYNNNANYFMCIAFLMGHAIFCATDVSTAFSASR
ncbi:hypothetical protein F0A07_24105, partial [Salmonella enterica subsp. enterica serovar Typhimurium]